MERKLLKGFEKGQIITARIIDIDVEKERISLGVKQLSDDPLAGAIEGISKGIPLLVQLRR